MSRELGRELFAGFSSKAMRQMLEYTWPGNVRELKNVVERAVYRLEKIEGPITVLELDPFDSPWRPRTASELAANPEPGVLRNDLRTWLDEQERLLVERAISECGGNRKRAAERLGLTYDQLRGILRKHQNDPE